MGRYLDVAGDPGNPLQGLSLDYSLAPALATTRVPVAAVSSPSDYNFWAYGLDEPLTAPTLEAFGALGLARRALARARPGAHRLAGHQHHPQRRSRRSPNTKANPASPRPSPTRPPAASSRTRLAALAAMLDDEALPIKCVSLNAVGGYDTHSDEAETLSTNLGQTVESVLAFQRDLEARETRRPRA